jgi:hypothetical protein
MVAIPNKVVEGVKAGGKTFSFVLDLSGSSGNGQMSKMCFLVYYTY